MRQRKLSKAATKEHKPETQTKIIAKPKKPAPVQSKTTTPKKPITGKAAVKQPVKQPAKQPAKPVVKKADNLRNIMKLYESSSSESESKSGKEGGKMEIPPNALKKQEKQDLMFGGLVHL
ncbi:unnamed protein product [Strongylus vulgaris]|uniref:Uncharacterized protein n=1 Tax=Strongylus vulgaris TaxID=40348 RepID=A0A3P7IHT5_STRVU|nr:unnamed protein product [Strongylus vulgaris]